MCSFLGGVNSGRCIEIKRGMDLWDDGLLCRGSSCFYYSEFKSNIKITGFGM